MALRAKFGPHAKVWHPWAKGSTPCHLKLLPWNKREMLTEFIFSKRSAADAWSSHRPLKRTEKPKCWINTGKKNLLTWNRRLFHTADCGDDRVTWWNETRSSNAKTGGFPTGQQNYCLTDWMGGRRGRAGAPGGHGKHGAETIGPAPYWPISTLQFCAMGICWKNRNGQSSASWTDDCGFLIESGGLSWL